MQVNVYAFAKRSSLIDPKNMHPIDDHLIRAMHIESIYDMLNYVGSVDLEKLEKAGLNDIVDRLRRRREAIINDNNVIKIIEDILKVKMPSNAMYIILRLD